MSQKIEMSATQVLSANGSTPSCAVSYLNEAAAITAWATGTFGAGTLKVDVSIDGVNWFDSGVAGITAAGILKLIGIAPRFVRGTLTGATAPSVSVVFSY